MSVIIDEEPLDVDALGLTTVGQVLARLHQSNRLVLSFLIDGQAPAAGELAAAKLLPLANHTLYVETADLRQTAKDALAHADHQLQQADDLRHQAADLFRTGKWNEALKPLLDCMALWDKTRQAVLTVSQLFHFDLDRVRIDSRPLSQMLEEFASQLRDIQSAIGQADLVRLTDLLTYEVNQSIGWWRTCVQILADMPPIAAPYAVQSAA